jgi:hypothetical protein
MQKDVILDTIFTAKGSCEGTWGISTSLMNRKNNRERKRSTNAPLRDTRFFGDGFSDIR